MSINELSVLAIVPARGGSKGIPGKNLKLLNGKSLVALAADVAAAVPEIDAALLSTDDEKIAAEGRRAGLDVPFLRPEYLASDRAGSIEMWQHAWLAAEDHYDRRFDVSVLLEPTSPLRRPADVKLALRLLFDTEAESVVAVSPTPAHFTPHKALSIDTGGLLEFYAADGAAYSNRHLIPRFFHRNGVCYVVRRQTLVESGKIFTPTTRPLVIERPVVNIDDPFDLELAEWLLSKEVVGEDRRP